MLLLDRQLRDVDMTVLEELVAGQVRESTTIDYKQELCVSTDGEKKEFLKDISSFANAGGGHIIYGVEEDDNAAASRVAGMHVAEGQDQVWQQLNSSIRTGVEPVIHGVLPHWVDTPEGRVVLVVHIPRSWQAPHRVKFQGHNKFWVRTEGSKQEMTIPELRQAFLLSDTIGQQMRDFHASRCGAIIAGRGVYPLHWARMLVLHMMPLAAFSGRTPIDPGKLDYAAVRIPGIERRHDYERRANVDGCVAYVRHHQGGCYGYVQVYRTGMVEAADSYLLGHGTEERDVLPVPWFPSEMRSVIAENAAAMRELGVQPPVIIQLSLLNVKGLRVPSGREMQDQIDMVQGQDRTFDREHVVFPDVLVQDLEADIGSAVDGMLNSIWRAGGHAGHTSATKA
ncbi:MAG TPA: hypothetical protein DGT21_20755 [Armatimonadetes bacterium]|nr:hypothetical protein [Armatimonadota bacterium]